MHMKILLYPAFTPAHQIFLWNTDILLPRALPLELWPLDCNDALPFRVSRAA